MSDVDRGADLARQLYARPLDGFIAARNVMARDLKNAGDVTLARRVTAFVKPSVAADVVNRIARGDTVLMEDVGRLGARLRSAQAASDAADLRALDRERRSLVVRSATAAAAVTAGTGRVATPATLREVEQTFWAALVDAHAFAAVGSGHLVRSLAPAGFGPVDITGATAVPIEVDDEDAAEPSRPTAARQRPREEQRRALREAEAGLRFAEDQLARAERRAAESRRRIADANQELDQLRAQIAAVEADLRAASAEEVRHRDSLRAAERARSDATTVVEKARRQLGDDD